VRPCSVVRFPGGIVKRREFLALIGGAVAARPVAVCAQQPAMPVIGFLSIRLADDVSSAPVDAFRQGLIETGYVPGQNVAVEYRWAANQLDRLPAFAIELVRRPVSVIAALGTASAQAAKAASTTVPIVFLTADDPVRLGLVASLNRPGANLTGVSFVSAMLGAKRLELLRTLVPKADLIAVLVDPNSAESQNQSRGAEEAGRALGQQVVFVNATPSEIERAFITVAQRGAGALLVSGSPSFGSQRHRIAALCAQHSLPALFSTREYSAAGGLMSYGASISDAYRQAAIYVGRILKGDRSSDLPVLQPTKFELVINLTTAKTLGLEIPDRLLALADEVIE
jgi:putative tryptophan/tyrosine transport system substrate-binding protein